MTKHLASPFLADCRGFGTLEAVIALLIASVSLTALTVVTTNSIDRARRAEQAFREVLALERLAACIPRIPRRSILDVSLPSVEPHPCLEIQSGLEVHPGAGVLRAVRSPEVPGKVLLVLDLENPKQ